MPLAIFTNGERASYEETRVRECRARAEAEKRSARETRAFDRGNREARDGASLSAWN